MPNKETAQERLCDWLKKNEGGAIALGANHPIPPLDDHIQFDEERHVYSVDGLEYRHSVTGFIKSFFEEFNERVTIDRIVGGKRWATDEDYAYFHMPPEAISWLWEENRDEASRLGTAMHAYIEHFYNGTFSTHLDADEMGEEYRQFHRFHEECVEGKLDAFRTELRAFSSDFELAGSVDMLYRRAGADEDDKTLVMYDWKRSKEIKSAAFDPRDFGKGPAQALSNCNQSHFFLQLNMYKLLIERATDYRIDEMYVACFHPNHKDYLRIPVPDMQETVRMMCEIRRCAMVKRDAVALEKGLATLAATSLGELGPSLLRKLKTRSLRLREKLCFASDAPGESLGAPLSDEE